MPHRLLARPAAEDRRAHGLAMSFGFADTLPSVNWSPPEAELLLVQAQAQAEASALDLPAVEDAWAATEPMGL